MTFARASRLCAALVASSFACAHQAPTPEAQANEPGEAVEDPLHGLQFELPAVEGGWQTTAEGTRLAKDVRVEVGSFPLPKPGTVNDCRETARARLADLKRAAEEEEARAQAESAQASKKGGASNVLDPNDLDANKSGAGELPAAPGGLDLPRDQATQDGPAPSWSFTRGANTAAVRSRWAFFVRGADCLLIEVTGPLEAPAAAERVFQHALRTGRAVPLPPERQREIDLLAGMGFLQQREPAAALDRFEALVQREPGFAIAHYGALMAAFELGPTAYARGLPHGLAALKNERDLSPDQRQLALSALGVMQLSQNQVKDAAGTLSELVVRSPELAEGQYNYACALARLGDPAGALEHLKAALKIDGGLGAHAREDDDLASLRGRADFEQLLHDAAPTARP